jgi:hypothetical protein
MKGKINEHGSLVLSRVGGEQVQVCPKSADDDECGDWCPLFGEPHVLAERPTFTRLVLCGGREWLFKEFVDERKENGNE